MNELEPTRESQEEENGKTIEGQHETNFSSPIFGINWGGWEKFKTLLLSVVGSTAISVAVARAEAKQIDAIPKRPPVVESMTVNPREERLIAERIGFNLAKIARENGFQADMEVDIGDGKYLVHVGQAHYSRTYGQSGEERVDSFTADVQRNLLELIKSVSDTSDDKKVEGVFVEGEAEDTVEGNNAAIEKMAGLWQDIIKVDFTDKQWTNKVDRLLQKIDEVMFAKVLRSVLNNHLHKFSKYIEGEDGWNSENGQALSKYFILLEHSDPDALIKFGGVSAAKLAGFVKKIFPAEDRDLNVMANNLITESEKITHRLKGVPTKPIDPEQKEKEAKKALEFYEQGMHIAMEPREDAAVTLVLENADSFKGNLLLFVYGADHDFKNNVEASNEKSSKKIGLIRLTPVNPNWVKIKSKYISEK